MLLKNATLATLSGSEPYGLMTNAALIIEDGRIARLGAAI